MLKIDIELTFTCQQVYKGSLLINVKASKWIAANQPFCFKWKI